jgi:imidazoleglycerol phosphate synthase cyclase subunit
MAVRVIPCLDIDKGRVVKGVRFQELRDAGDPVECARTYEAQGADEIVFLDVSATTEGRKSALGTVRRVRSVLSIPLTAGGGVRDGDDAAALLEAGADKVSINTAAVANPGLVSTMSNRFGSQCTVVAIDAAATDDSWEVVTHGGRSRTGIDAVDWAVRAGELGAGEILLTSWDRDGTRSGYDLALIATVSESVDIPVIASGGAGNPDHVAAAIRAGASAALLASLLHDRVTTISRVKSGLQEAGIEVRPC